MSMVFLLTIWIKFRQLPVWVFPHVLKFE